MSLSKVRRRPRLGPAPGGPLFLRRPTPGSSELHDHGTPGLRVMGGMASGSQVPRRKIGSCSTAGSFEDGRGRASPVVGTVSVRTLVSQGCRPIGRPMIVTKADRNLIRELGRRPRLEVLREVFEANCPKTTRSGCRPACTSAGSSTSIRTAFGRGDFLVRNVMGADDSGGIAITDHGPGRPDRPVPRP